MGQLTERLGTSVYLDTNIIIYAVEGYETHAAPIKSLLRGLTEGEIIAVTSELTVAEVLVKPKRDGNAKLEEAYRRFLLPTPSLRTSTVSRDILEAAASIRAASAQVARRDSLGYGNDRALRFFSNERRWIQECSRCERRYAVGSLPG